MENLCFFLQETLKNCILNKKIQHIDKDKFNAKIAHNKGIFPEN